MLRTKLKTLGIIEIVIATLGIAAFLYALFALKGTWVIPGVIMYIAINVLLVLSGIGLILGKQGLFLCTFYAWTLICLQRIGAIIEFITSEKSIGNINTFKKVIFNYPIVSGLTLIILIGLSFFLLSKDVLAHFNVTKRSKVIMHIVIAAVFFIIFTITFHQ